MLLVKNKPNLQAFIDKYGDRWPLLKEFKATEQDKEWHAEGDVHIHTDMVLYNMYLRINDGTIYNVSEVKILMFAAALHDYGKPITSKPVERPDGMHIGAPRHEEVGASLLLNTECPEELAQWEWLRVIQLICYHQMPKKLLVKDKGYGDYVRLMDAVTDLKWLAMLEEADMRGRICADYETNLLYVELFKDEIYSHSLQCPYTFRRYWHGSSSELYYRTTAVLGDQIQMMDEGKSLPFNYDQHSTVTMMCGLSGSGKSTIAKDLARVTKAKIISMDEIRDNMGGRSKPDNNEVHRIAMEQLRDSLRKKEDVIWDATNYRKDFRSKIADLSYKYGAYVRIMVVVQDVEVCIKRDAIRHHSVGHEVIRNQYNKFQIPHYEEAHYVEFINAE